MIDILVSGFFLLLCYAYTISARIFETWHIITFLMIILLSTLLFIFENQYIKVLLYLIFDIAAIICLPFNFYLPSIIFAFKHQRQKLLHLSAFVVLFWQCAHCYQLFYITFLTLGALICRAFLNYYQQ